jgi:hypothetical protein
LAVMNGFISADEFANAPRRRQCFWLPSRRVREC